MRRGAFAPVLRLTAFAVVVVATVLALGFRFVRAQVTELLLDAGATFTLYPGERHEGARELQLNGIDVSFRTQTVNIDLTEVLEHYEELCDASAIATNAKRDANEGFVACLDAGHVPRTMDAAVDRLVRFSETGDLHDLGGFRYVFARRLPSADEDSTFLLTAWSDSAVNVLEMLPRGEKDASGHDPVGVPRPAGLQRVLSAFEHGGPSSVFVYRVKAEALEGLRGFYRSQLVRGGWSIVERHPGESIRIDEIQLISAENESRLVTILLRPGDSDQATLTILTSEPSWR